MEMDAFRGRHLQLMNIRAKSANVATTSSRPTTAEYFSRHRNSNILVGDLCKAVQHHDVALERTEANVESSTPHALQQVASKVHTGQGVESNLGSKEQLLEARVIDARFQEHARQQLAATVMVSPRQWLRQQQQQQQQQQRVTTSGSPGTHVRPKSTPPKARLESVRVGLHAYRTDGMMRGPHTSRELRATLLPNNGADCVSPLRRRPWGAGFQQQPRQLYDGSESPANVPLVPPSFGTARMRSRHVARSHLAVAMHRQRAAGGAAAVGGRDGARGRLHPSPHRRGVAPVPFVPQTCPPIVRMKTRVVPTSCG